MPSKRSSFNRTLFRKNLTRFWPLWGGATLLGCLAPLYLLLTLVSMPWAEVSALDFAALLYSAVTTLVPGITLVYAILCAMAVWGYLYTGRSVGLMHALPIDRTGLFLTSTLSGLAMMLIPYAVVGGLSCLVALGGGFMDVVAVLYTAAAVVLLSVLFFGMATFWAMCTGNAFALPVFYLVGNFFAPAAEALVRSFASQFLFGLGSGVDGVLNWLSPIVQIYTRFTCRRVYDEGNTVSVGLEGLSTVALYALAGLGLLALGWLLCRLRRSESAGDVVAFRWLRPVFRYGMALAGALTLGQVLYTLIWGELFQKGEFADLLPMGVCLVLTGMVGYYVASMLLEKTPRVFRGSWRGALAVCAGAALLLAAVVLDPFGAETRVPRPEDVATLSLSGPEGQYLELDGERDRALVERVMDLQRAIVADKAYVAQTMETRDGWDDVLYMTFHYELKSGGRLRRSYRLPLSAERWTEEGTYDQLLNALYNAPAVLGRQVEAPLGYVLSGAYVYNHYQGYSQDGSLDPQRLYTALLADLEEGNIPGYAPESVPTGRLRYAIELELEFRARTEDRNGGYRYSHRSITLWDSMTHTMDVLVEEGACTREELAQWAQVERDAYGAVPATAQLAPVS